MSEKNPDPEKAREAQDEAKPAVMAELALDSGDGPPVLVMHDGSAIPGTITVKNPQGEPVATYTAGPVPVRARIVGGEPATPHEFPWMVDVRR